MFEYSTKKLYTFFSVPKNLLTTSCSPDSSNFVGVHAGEPYIRYHLTASDPYFSNISNGLTVFPFDFDIFFPFLSRIRSFTSTFLYGDCPFRNVDIAMRE